MSTSTLLPETPDAIDDVDEVIRRLQADPKAFYDPKTGIRRLPVFEYDPTTGAPSRIFRWAERKVIPDVGGKRSELLLRCSVEGADTYIEGIGWVHNGKKREGEPNPNR